MWSNVTRAVVGMATTAGSSQSMAVRLGSPRPHTFTLLRSPFGIPLRKQAQPHRNEIVAARIHVLNKKGTLPLCACLKDRILSECGLCKVEPAMTRQPWSVRGMRIAAEVPKTIAKPAMRGENSSSEESELEEGESAELPEELREDLESTAWSVRLDGLNVEPQRRTYKSKMWPSQGLDHWFNTCFIWTNATFLNLKTSILTVLRKRRLPSLSLPLDKAVEPAREKTLPDLRYSPSSII